MGVDFSGATAFWSAAYSLDVDAMRLLVRYGADPHIPTMTYGAPRRDNDASGLPAVPTGGPHVPPLHAASGVGYGTSRVAQQHRHVPDGWIRAAKYFIEELGVDVNIRNADGFTALHHAAARGDNDTILYLISRGADVMVVNRAGQTTVDMANSPEQRRSRSRRRLNCSRSWARRTITIAARASEGYPTRPPVRGRSLARRDHSSRRAVIGSIRAARRAGR